MLKIRRPLGRLIFNMGIAIPGKSVFLIETAPRWPCGPHISLCKQLSISGVDAMALDVARSSAVMILTMWNENVFFFYLRIHFNLGYVSVLRNDIKWERKSQSDERSYLIFIFPWINWSLPLLQVLHLLTSLSSTLVYQTFIYVIVYIV